MMSQRSKRELTEAIRPRYLKANKSSKEQILNEFVAATGIIVNMPFACYGTV